MLRNNGTTFPAQWFSDFMVDPAYRVHGIGPLLVARAVSGTLPTLSDAPTSQSRTVLDAVGFRELKGPERMHLPLAPSRVAFRLLRRMRLGNHSTLVAMAASLAPAYLAWRTRRLQGRNLPVVTKCGWSELAEFIARAQKKITSPHVVHDAAFFNWRSSRFGEGLAGMHGLRTADGGYVLFGKHSLCLYVFDWAASSWEECCALFAAARSAGRMLGADSLSVLVNGQAERQWLRSLGFFAAQPPYRLFCYSPRNLPFPIAQLHCSHCDAHANL
jgi:hypothetical protein